ncbi:MAG: hypothetical protein Crog4KO_03740 [Crocinitomicaceae bacterium]
MKDAFENSFKENLDNFEMPYDSAAWNAMQSRLDATASTPSFEDKMKDGLDANQYPYNPAAWTAMSSRLDKANKGGFKKWYVAAGIIGAAVITTAILWPSASDNETPTKQVAQKSSTSTIAKDDNVKNGGKTQGNVNSQSSSNKENTPSNNVVSPASNGNTANATVSTPNGQAQNNQQNNTANQSNQQTTTQTTVQHTVNTPIPSGNGTTVETRKFILPAIPESVCEGETIQIKNENDYAIVVIYPNGLNWVGRENQVTRLNPSIAGTYKVGYLRNDNFKKKSEFVVNEAALADFDFVDISQKYLDGLPTIEVRSTSKASAYTWEYQNGTVRGEEVGLHFYEKGIHPVKMTVTNENGCSATVEKTVNVDEDYNLLAMTAFFPNGNDRETNTFMPYALMQRDADFTMIILDPNDGHVMFETSDSNEGWNGVDQQTGAQAPMGKSYIWKVTVLNPEKGESSNYTGTVLTLQQ